MYSDHGHARMGAKTVVYYNTYLSEANVNIQLLDITSNHLVKPAGSVATSVLEVIIIFL